MQEQELLGVGFEHGHGQVFLGYLAVLVDDVGQLHPLLGYYFEFQALGCQLIALRGLLLDFVQLCRLRVHLNGLLIVVILFTKGGAVLGHIRGRRVPTAQTVQVYSLLCVFDVLVHISFFEAVSSCTIMRSCFLLGFFAFYALHVAAEGTLLVILELVAVRSLQVEFFGFISPISLTLSQITEKASFERLAGLLFQLDCFGLEVSGVHF